MKSARLALVGSLMAWLLLAAGPVQAQESPAAAETLEARLLAAAESGASEPLASLLQAHRLAVKPVVHALLGRSMTARLAGDAAEAATQYRLARTLAEAFAERFGEQSLRYATDYVAAWSPAQLAAKLRADSLYAAGTDLRGSRATRPEALALYRQAEALYERLDDRIGQGTVLGGLGVLYWYGGDGDSTRHFFEAALAARRAADDRQLVGNSLNDLGIAHRLFFRDHTRALAYLRDAEDLRIALGDSVGLGKTLGYVAGAYEALGHLEEAVAYYDRAAAVNAAVGDLHRAATALTDAGVVYKNLGRHSEALPRLERALDIRKARGETDRAADVLNWIGVVQRWLGNYEAALENYGEVLRLAEAAGDTLARAHAEVNIGVVYYSAGRAARGVTFLERAIAGFEAMGDAEHAMVARHNLASNLLDQERYDEARAEAEAVIAASRTFAHRRLEARTLALHGNILNRAGLFEEALASYAESLRQAEGLSAPDIMWVAHIGLGDVHERTGDYATALGYYDQAFETLERVRLAQRSDEEKAGFLAQQRYAYEDVVHLTTRLHQADPEAGYDERAFAYAEQAKARAFLDLLAEALAGVREGVDPALLARQQTVLSERGALQQAVAAADAGARDSLQAALDALDADYRALQRTMRQENPRYAALQYPTPATLREVQADLEGSEAVVLAYAVGDSSSTLWAVSATQRQLIRLPGREVLDAQVALVRYALTDPAQHDAARYAAAAHRLYELLVAPAEALIGTDRPLIVVPDGPLFYLPFEALVTQPAPSAEAYTALPFLVRRHAVSYGPSVSVLKQLRRDRRETGRDRAKQFLAFGDPVFSAAAGGEPLGRLAYSGDEVRNIAGLFDAGSADVFLREAASEARVKTEDALADYRYVHFATHGLIDERRPDYSGVALAGAAGEDGLLQAAEIFNLRLNADLVVLSACETGIGKEVRGEGLVGLTRAFMYAGAASLVVSLWSVADRSTAQLMEAFYGELVNGPGDKAEALRQAKLALVADEALAHPFHWAPFVLTGNPH